ncbi:hypothetical protein ACGFZP_13340 [Kitasatospora sp. NPDC048239]|uniref:hypothetical protein n=1 Tax=Kitasatospora sp. NPDC048239 TaxID=3364046 RepID=UPI00371B1222
MNPELIVLVPTRGRPGNLRDLWAAFEETCVRRTVLVACVDEDDPRLPEYEALVASVYDQQLPDITADESGRLANRFRRLWLVTGPRLRLGGTLNEVAPVMANSCGRIAFMGDDHRPVSLGWDQQYIAELDRLGTGIVYGNDLIQGPNLPTQVAMTSDIVLATGYMVPPGLVHLYIDNAWLALGRALDAITYLPDVVVEHKHPIAGRAEWDQGYAECNTDERSDADRATFERWRDQDLARWVKQIKEHQR